MKRPDQTQHWYKCLGELTIKVFQFFFLRFNICFKETSRFHHLRLCCCLTRAKSCFMHDAFLSDCITLLYFSI